jgi:hypothetical protein
LADDDGDNAPEFVLSVVITRSLTRLPLPYQLRCDWKEGASIPIPDLTATLVDDAVTIKEVLSVVVRNVPENSLFSAVPTTVTEVDDPR